MSVKNKTNKNYKRSQKGRSMVEMLGVLAIIGVLSVGGIAGYTTAMRSYKANEIINATSMLYMMGLSQNAGEGTGSLTFDTAFGASMRPSGCTGITYTGDKATLSVNIEDETICKQVKIKLGDKAGDCTAATGGATGYTLTVTMNPSAGNNTPSGPSDDDPSTAGFYVCGSDVEWESSLAHENELISCGNDSYCYQPLDPPPRYESLAAAKQELCFSKAEELEHENGNYWCDTNLGLLRLSDRTWSVKLATYSCSNCTNPSEPRTFTTLAAAKSSLCGD